MFASAASHAPVSTNRGGGGGIGETSVLRLENAAIGEGSPGRSMRRLIQQLTVKNNETTMASAAAAMEDSTATSTATVTKPSTAIAPVSLAEILQKAGQRALGGGMTGAIAGIVQVLSLMWLRTVINYQCRYGTSFGYSLHVLLKEGGISRLYRGLTFAIIQAPLARFGSTAANDGVQTLLANLSMTASWGPARTTLIASVVVGLWRMLLMPIDTIKTVLQVDSVEGYGSLWNRVRAGQVGALYAGSIANAVGAVVGHYPWFFAFNLLSSSRLVRFFFPATLIRNAFIGLVASIVSDTVVNAIRVVKVTKQALGTQRTVSYAETIKIILAVDGWRGLMGRGLRARIAANALQSILFTIIWQSLAERFSTNNQEAEKER